jgi:uncharacterized protein (DUF952 family)
LNLRDGADIAELEGAQVTTIYKICGQSAWREAESSGGFRGSEADARDGFIHFSTATQVAETAARHFANERDLVLVAVDADALAQVGAFARRRPFSAPLRAAAALGGALDAAAAARGRWPPHLSGA